MTTNNKLKVGVIMGGKSSECEVSLATGRYILNLLDPQKYTGFAIYMDKLGGFWKLPLKLVIMNTTRDLETRLDEAEKVSYEELSNLIDFAFIALLGKFGEDGAIQGLLELLGIPYTGSGILASSIAMHKRVSKRLLQANGFVVGKDITLYRADFKTRVSLDAINQNINATFGYPVIVKPVTEGSSIGVTFVSESSDLEDAINEAFKWDDELLIEEFINGQEFMCVIIGNKNPTAMKPSEVEFQGKIFTYDEKYMPGKAVYHTPIRTKEENIKDIQEQAERAYEFLGILGFGRVDGFLKGDRVYLSEPHTGTIMVPSSYVFQQATLQDIPENSEEEHTMKLEDRQIKTKGGNKFNPKTFITNVIEMGIEAHTNKKGVL